MDLLSAVAAAVQALAAVALAAAVVAPLYATHTYSRSVQNMLETLREQIRLGMEEANARVRLLERFDDENQTLAQKLQTLR